MLKKNIIFRLIIAFILVLGFSVSLKYVDHNNLVFNFDNKLFYVLIFCGVYVLLEKIKIVKLDIKQLIFSMLVSLFNLVSYFYYNYHSLHYMYCNVIQMLKCILYFVSFTILVYIVIYLLFECLKKLKFKETKNSIIDFVFNKHPFLCVFIILFIIYFIYLMITFPGIVITDSLDEIRQYNHVQTISVKFINLISESMYINGHHSVFHTVITGFIFNLFHSDVIGIFANCFLQMLFCSLVIAYTFVFMKKIKVPNALRVIILLIYAFLPPILTGSCTLIKDIPFSIFVLLLTCLLIEYFVLKENSIKKLIMIIIVSLLVTLISNKGIYVILATTICYLLYFKREKLRLIVFVLPIFLFLVYSRVVLPYYDITPGSPREMLSIPIQQIAKTVIDHDSSLKSSDKKTIDNIIEYDKLKDNYDPIFADPIKNNYFNKDYTEKEMNDFMHLWINLSYKYPSSYISALNNMYSGYFYFDKFSPMGYYTMFVRHINVDSFDKTLKHSHPGAVSFIKRSVNEMNTVPVVGLLFSVAFYVWLLLLILCYVIFYNKIKNVIPIIPCFIVLLFCLVSPVSGNFRYIYPLIYTIPVIVCYLWYLIHYEKNNSKN